MKDYKKVVVFGAGYVGLSLSIYLAQTRDVKLIEVDEKKIELINDGKSPIFDEEIEKYLKKESTNIRAMKFSENIISESEIFFLALPTDYDLNLNAFNTEVLQDTIIKIRTINPNAPIVIKSTVPFGFVSQMENDYKIEKLFFSPEFLREGRALKDHFSPSRIIVGGEKEIAESISKLLTVSVINKPNVHIMESSEAEIVKLSSNSYLAMRVAYFNEIDSFCLLNNLSSKKVIDGMSDDQRISAGYNNPSFGYGGYCFPKDTKQLESSMSGVPQNLVSAIVDSNVTRKKLLSKYILAKSPKTIGIYRLIMKTGSDNFRDSAVLDMISNFKKEGKKIYIYEPLLKKAEINDCEVISNIKVFFDLSELIIANRYDKNLIKVQQKVFSRDVYNNN